MLLLIIGGIGTSIAQNVQEVVYLKNGSVIRGIVVEQVPGESLKIRTNDGSVFAYKMSDVEKITKEVGNSNSQTRSLNNGIGIKAGYKAFVDFGYTLGTGIYGSDRIELMTTHGVQINPYLFVGAGTGCHYYTDGAFFSIPIFADVRATILKNNVTPYIDCKIGYSVVDIEGFYLSPSIGCRFAIGEKSGVYVGAGYVMQKEKIGYGDYAYNRNRNGISLKLGFDF